MIDALIGNENGHSVAGWKWESSNSEECHSCMMVHTKGVKIGEWIDRYDGNQFIVVSYCRDCSTMMGDSFFQVFGEQAYDLLQ